MINPLKILGAVTQAIGNLVDKTPASGVHQWVKNSASNSRASREVLRIVVYVCTGCIVYTLYMAFKLIMAGKMDVTAGTVTGSICVLLGSVLAVAIPSFASSLNSYDASTGSGGQTTPTEPKP